MGIMGRPHLDRPFLHSLCNLISNTSVKLCSMHDRSLYCLECLLGHIPTHLIKIKYILSEIFRYRCIFCIESAGLMGCSLVQSSFSECSHN